MRSTIAVMLLLTAFSAKAVDCMFWDGVRREGPRVLPRISVPRLDDGRYISNLRSADWDTRRACGYYPVQPASSTNAILESDWQLQTNVFVEVIVSETNSAAYWVSRHSKPDDQIDDEIELLALIDSQFSQAPPFNTSQYAVLIKSGAAAKRAARLAVASAANVGEVKSALIDWLRLDAITERIELLRVTYPDSFSLFDNTHLGRQVEASDAP